MGADARSFVVHGHTANALRRQLGPTGWAVLEELLAHTDSTDDGNVAAASVRSLAAAVGLSKDTVARALGRLREAGIVTAEQSRASTGTFTAGTYRITVPSCITFSEPTATTDPASRPRRTPSRSPNASQLSLIDLDPGTP